MEISSVDSRTETLEKRVEYLEKQLVATPGVAYKTAGYFRRGERGEVVVGDAEAGSALVSALQELGVSAERAEHPAADRGHDVPGEGKGCPRCGFCYKWDGERCGHCGYLAGEDPLENRSAAQALKQHSVESGTSSDSER